MVSMKSAKKKPNLHQVYVDDEIWEKSKPFLDSVGLSRSRFVQLMLQHVIDAETKTMVQAQGDLFDEMMACAKKKGKLKK